ncbi:MAG: TolC family protein [Acidobacteria bacterium]|nr:TolC family protein [Acidobacteriota bacterium]
MTLRRQTRFSLIPAVFGVVALSSVVGLAQDRPAPTTDVAATAGYISTDRSTDNYSPSTTSRIGVQTASPLPMSLDEAIKRALANNNDIEVSRTDVRIADTTVRGLRGLYDPVFTFQPTFSHSSSTGQQGTNDVRLNGNINQRIKPGGGTIQGFFNNTRTENAFAQAQVTSGGLSSSSSAIYSSQLGFNFTQPLLRNFGIDSTRRQIKIAKKQLQQSDSDFQLQATNTITSVQQAYWDLVLALRNQQNQKANVELARENLRQITAKIDAGAAAPLEKAEVETELANREGDLLLATQQVSVSENTLKKLVIRDALAPEWAQAIVPTDSPKVVPLPSDLNAAINDAFDNRFELRRLKLQRDINDLDIRYFKNQAKPQIDLSTTFSLDGIARGNVSTANSLIPQFTGNDEILRQKLNTLFAPGSQLPNPLVTVPGSPPYFVGGFNRSMGNMFRSDAPNYSIGVTFSFPFFNRTAKANLAGAKITGERIAAQTRAQEETVLTDVRNAVQAVETARLRVDTARRARQSAETQLAGERKLYDAGRSTTFLLFQRENALLAAQNAEIRAETDYAKAVADRERATATSFREHNITIDRPVDIK